MATKVALTAEEFRENSQRSIALFNTEKLSTNSTHVLKSAYCNSVHFCRCNLHGACGGKARAVPGNSACACCNLHGACGGKVQYDLKPSVAPVSCNLHGACGGKESPLLRGAVLCALQSARSVWRQRGVARETQWTRALQSARSVWRQRRPAAERRKNMALQSARSVWRQSQLITAKFWHLLVAICTGRVEDLASSPEKNPRKFMQTYCIFIHFGV